MYISVSCIHLKFSFTMFGDGKEINITLSKMDHLHTELGHARVVISMPSTIHFTIGKINKLCGQCSFHYNLDI